jgi:hypothetical protein
MNRRDFLLASAGLVAGAGLPPRAAGEAPVGGAPRDFDDYALRLLRGFLRNARRTAPGHAVCDFEGGTLVKSCLTPSGHTYVSVARMLPLLADWREGGRERRIPVDGEEVDLDEVVLEIFRNAFDPAFPNYWGAAPSDRATQRSVEAALVADALGRLGDPLLSRLTSPQRANVQAWLASCTQVPERSTNHAWFTAMNQAARLRLSERWPEFWGDEAWMLADLKALDALFSPGNDGWYSDSPQIPIYDYYNFWTFANFPLLWSRLVGDRYPEWRERFHARVRLFLEGAPHFFAADGSHPLFGRSLLYRWAIVSPLLLGYRQGLWPHSPGLLRHIVRLDYDWYWRMGAFDERRGALRETLSAGGTPAVREGYIENGSPYWATLGMQMYSIPPHDPFWTEPEEPLPVERGDYVKRFEGPRMLLAGTRVSGEVRWLQARNAPKFLRYRDAYAKLSASSHFPPCRLKAEDHCAWDQELVFRDPATGASATRVGVLDGALTGDGLTTDWWTELAGRRIEVRTRIRLMGEFEQRTHTLLSPGALADTAIELLEGSPALGLAQGEAPHLLRGGSWCVLRSRGGLAVASWRLGGWASLSTDSRFDEEESDGSNLVYPAFAVNTLHGSVDAATEFSALHYASPKPPSLDAILRGAGEWIPALRGRA